MLRYGRLAVVLTAGALVPAPSSARAQDARPDRFPQIETDKMTEAQRGLAATLPALNGPFNIMLRGPIFAERVQALAAYLRADSPLPARLKEFAILITARLWTAQYEWWGHYPVAMKTGLSPTVAADLAAGKRPGGMRNDEAALYDFLIELHRRHAVDDDVFRRARDALGEQQLVDLIGLSGLYDTVSMMLDAGEVGLPAGATPLPPLPETAPTR